MPVFHSIRKRLSSGREARQTGERIYRRILAQARTPVFFIQFGVPDSVDGRFDLLVLHIHLVLERLRAIDGTRELQRALQEVFFTDMDRSLREMGVGDLSVGKRMKDIAAACYGRFAAYDAARTTADLAGTLARNLWRGAPPAAELARELARYVEAQRVHLAGIDGDTLLAGDVEFAGPPLGAAA